MAIKSFRDLRVWQAGMDLVERIYSLTQTFAGQELCGLAGQMREAAVSIPSKIAEGTTREHREEYLQQIALAQASLAALQTQLEIAGRLDYLSSEQVCTTLEQAAVLGKWLQSLRSALAKRDSSPSTASPVSSL